MIESRYIIEYINPESKEKTGGKKSILLFSFLGLIIIAALIYSFFSINKLNQLVRVTQNALVQAINTAGSEDDGDDEQSVQIAAIDVKAPSQKSNNTIQQKIEKPLLKNKKQTSQSIAQLATNKKLNDSINNLTKQLMAERKKDKALDKQLNSQKNENNQLSELLETTLSKANKTDKSYLSALNKLEEKEKTNTIVATSINNNKQINSDIKVVALKEPNPNTADSYNSISLSTNSQIDAIIAAMQGGATPSKTSSKVIKTNVDKTKEVQLAAASQTNPTELFHIQLQRQVDQIINKGSAITKTNKTYKKALEKESNIRKNAVRSITIKRGETLWSVAKRAYGNGSFYKKIINANPQINLDKLYVGQVIRVPN